MTQCHPLAGKALRIISYLTEKWGVGIDIDAGEVPLQDCVDICWPYNRSLQYGPPLGLSDEDSVFGLEDQGAGLRMTEITMESLQHPLFSPFLELRKQTSVTETALRQAGFSHLD